MKNFILFFLTLFVFFSCGTKRNTTNTTKEELKTEILWNELEKTVDSSGIDIHLPKIFHASRTLTFDLLHTKLELTPKWSNSSMNGKASLTIKAHFDSIEKVVLDAKAMDILSVKLNQKELKYSYDSLQLHIDLDKKYSRFEPFTIDIEYIAQPEKRALSSGQAITSDKGLYFINPSGVDKNKMPQIWTQGETESNSVWFPTIDSPNAKTAQEIILHVEDKYVTLSNGKLISSKKNGDGTRTDHWEQKLSHSPYLFMLFVGEFKIVKDYYTRPDGSKMEVFYYVEPEWESFAKDIFGETPQMIAYFSKLTGVEYPWDKYHQVVVRDYVSGAMENTGAVVFGEFVYKNKRELIDENDNSTIAHELFHHWFGDLVSCESWSNLPLNESFANYSQYLWDEYRYGRDEADYQAEKEKEGYFNQVNNSGGHPLIWHDYQDKEQMFDGHSYNKGGRILHLLRKTLGDSVFFQSLSLYLKTNRFKAAEYHQLRLAFEEVSGQDLNWFFSQWFEKSGHPKIDVEQYYSAANQELVLTVYQNQDLSNTPLYRLPIKIMIEDEAGQKIIPIDIQKVENKFVFPVKGKLKNVCFDYEKALFGEIKEYKPVEQYVHEYYSSKRYLSRKNALIEASKKINPEVKKMLFDALSDPFWEIRKTAIEQIRLLDESYAEKVNEKLIYLAKNDVNSKVRNESLIYLFQTLPTEDDKISLYINCLKTDSSYLVLGTSLELLAELRPSLAIENAKILEQENSNKIRVKIAQLYSSKGDDKHYPFFTELFKNQNFSYYDGIICLNSFSIYLSNQSPDLQLNALPIYKDILLKGSSLIKTFMGQNISFIINKAEEQIKELKAKIEFAEKKNLRTEVNLYQDLLDKYETVIKSWTEFFTEYESTK
ncbi:MAG: M1 family metallopeptidase [Flavobacteriia bacterium]|nr:M1 family metallopeptidase [Flavobacteriia bacterium]